MGKLSELWSDFVKLNSLQLNSGITDKLQNNSDWLKLPEELKYMLKSHNGQKKSNIGIFGKLKNGKTDFSYHYLDFELIFKTYKRINKLKKNEIGKTEIPFAVFETQDFGGFGFSINSENGQISYISFNEYDYQGGTVHNKGKYKYADSMIEFLENQIMLKQFE